MDQPQQTAVPPVSAQYEPCQECGAPMDRQQRYCVNCAARRADVANPAAQYFASASRNRTRAAANAGAAKAKSGNSRAASVIFFTLLPVAVAVGILVGRGGGNGSGDAGNANAALIKALSSGSLASAGAGAGADAAAADGSSADTATQPIVSDFSLQKGFAVSVGEVPIKGATSADVSKAKSDATKKGAKDVGIIDPTKFTITPKPKAGDYIVYSGEFKTKSEATKALSGLKKSFPKAEVISVTSSTDATGAKVLAKTDHGTVHEVTNYHAPPAKVKSDTNLVNTIANDTGQDYLKHQQDLPDVVVVGGDPNNAPPLPTGAGD